MKQWISYLMLAILSFQIIPVKALGKLLASNSMIEEIHPSGDCDGNQDGDPTLKIKKATDFPRYCWDGAVIPYSEGLIQNNVLIALHATERLPHGPVAEIHSPPPNC